MSPDEAAETMKEKGHYTDDVCKAHTALNKYALNKKQNQQKGKQNETND